MIAHTTTRVYLQYTVLMMPLIVSVFVPCVHGFDFGFGPALARLDASCQVVPHKEFSDTDGFYKIRSFDLKARVPLVKKQSFDNGKVSICRLSAQAEFERSYADITFLPRQHMLYEGKGGISCMFSKSKKHSFLMSANTGFAEDDESIDNARLRFSGMFLGNYRKSRTFSFIYGIGYMYVFGRGFPFPSFGLHWKPAPKWDISSILPVLTRVSYEVNDRTSINSIVGAAGNRSRISNENVFAGEDRVINLKIIQAIVSFGIDHEVSDIISLYGSTGVYFARNFSLVDDDENDIVKSKLPPAVFVRAGMRFTVPDRSRSMREEN